MALLPDAYFAGFFDGEGYVGIRRRRVGRSKSIRWGYALSVSVVNTHYPVLEHLVIRFGGTIGKSTVNRLTKKPCYVWQLHSVDNAGAFLEALLPHLVVKRAQAELALEWAALAWRPCVQLSNGQWRALTVEQLYIDDLYCTVLKALKRGGAISEELAAYRARRGLA